jgi:hypothetical protein
LTGRSVEGAAGIDPNVPNVAHVYDYLLGGVHNFAADRELAGLIEISMPHVRDVVWLNRSFLRRAARHMVGAGIRQFITIDSGIPTIGNAYKIAQGRDSTVNRKASIRRSARSAGEVSRTCSPVPRRGRQVVRRLGGGGAGSRGGVWCGGWRDLVIFSGDPGVVVLLYTGAGRKPG